MILVCNIRGLLNDVTVPLGQRRLYTTNGKISPRAFTFQNYLSVTTINIPSAVAVC